MTPSGVLVATPGHGSRTGAAEELEQDAFGNIVPVVSGGDGPDPAIRGVLEQGPVATAPPRRFSGRRPFIVIREVDEFEWDLEGCAQSVAEVRVAIGLEPRRSWWTWAASR